jgi:hypothetical protein
MKITKSQLKIIIREEMEQMQLQDLQPQVDAVYNILQSEMEKVPEEVRGIVLQAVTAKLAEDSKAAESLEEVSSEKQRRWACAQKDKPTSERAKGLSAAEAEEMCKSKIEEDG